MEPDEYMAPFHTEDFENVVLLEVGCAGEAGCGHGDSSNDNHARIPSAGDKFPIVCLSGSRFKKFKREQFRPIIWRRDQKAQIRPVLGLHTLKIFDGFGNGHGSSSLTRACLHARVRVFVPAPNTLPPGTKHHHPAALSVRALNQPAFSDRPSSAAAWEWFWRGHGFSGQCIQ